MPLLHVEPLNRRTTKSDLLAFLETVGGLDRRRIGRIELRAREATIEVPEGWQSRLVQALDGQALAGRRVGVWTDASPAFRSDGQDHFDRLGRLLELESKAQAEQATERIRRLSPADAERMGTSLVDLVIADEDTGLGGRHLVRLVKRKRSPLPWTRLGVGSPVVLSPNTNKVAGGQRGVGDWFASLVERIGSDAATTAPALAVVQFDITGAQGHTAFLTLAEGQGARLTDGTHETPDVSITAVDADWLALINGLIGPEEALLGGKLKISGDINLALQMAEAISLAPPGTYRPGRWRLDVNYLDILTVNNN